MKKLTRILFAAFTVCLVNCSFADTTNNSAATPNPIMVSNQFYVGADAGIGTTNCDNCAIQGKFSSCSISSTSNTNFAGTVFAGFKPNTYVGVEFG